MASSLESIARHVNWYSDPERLLANADLFLCQVMARAGFDDIVTVQQYFPPSAFEKAYLHAPPGLFTPRAWAYWGLMLGHADLPLPERFPGSNDLNWRKPT